MQFTKKPTHMHFPANKQHVALGHDLGCCVPSLTLMVPHALGLSSDSGQQTSWTTHDT